MAWFLLLICFQPLLLRCSRVARGVNTALLDAFCFWLSWATTQDAKSLCFIQCALFAVWITIAQGTATEVGLCEVSNKSGMEVFLTPAVRKTASEMCHDCFQLPRSVLFYSCNITYYYMCGLGQVHQTPSLSRFGHQCITHATPARQVAVRNKRAPLMPTPPAMLPSYLHVTVTDGPPSQGAAHSKAAFSSHTKPPLYIPDQLLLQSQVLLNKCKHCKCVCRPHALE